MRPSAQVILTGLILSAVMYCMHDVHVMRAGVGGKHPLHIINLYIWLIKGSEIAQLKNLDDNKTFNVCLLYNKCREFLAAETTRCNRESK